MEINSKMSWKVLVNELKVLEMIQDIRVGTLYLNTQSNKIFQSVSAKFGPRTCYLAAWLNFPWFLFVLMARDGDFWTVSVVTLSLTVVFLQCSPLGFLGCDFAFLFKGIYSGFPTIFDFGPCVTWHHWHLSVAVIQAYCLWSNQGLLDGAPGFLVGLFIENYLHF